MIASTAPNEAATPKELERLSLAWSPTTVPGSVDDENADERDWWYRCDIPPGDERTLRFDGLATIADIFLNGELALHSDNMFVRHRLAISGQQTTLHICFRSLNAALAEKRPRPRWKTRLVKHQQLRWFRTSLLGRMSSWPAPNAIVGPWRAVEFDDTPDFEIRTRLEGNTGVVTVNAPPGFTLTVNGMTADRELRIERANLWWPHTHGTPSLYEWTLQRHDTVITRGRLGFRTIEARRDAGDFALVVNGVPIFCRGACWTRGELASLDRLRDAGANMIRVGGTMVYEDDSFYARCDELGLIVWQDFMFANMDYPTGDARWLAGVREEATQQIARLRRHPSIAVWCGNSEVAQQAAMLGVPRELWSNALFGELLPSLCDGDVYVPSTPTGGALPFHTGSGVTHYYGVGAYRRPLTDARRANVRFTSECLGFANIGDDFDPADPKRGVPRDAGSEWDFADVSDHYLRELFDVDPDQLRATDFERYAALSRVTSGEVMSQVFSEWRSTGSSCNGALVWFLQDFSSGAGWGILDHRGKPKACWYALRRIWQPQTVVLTDEGLNGLRAHVINETNEPLAATLELTLLRDGEIVIARGETTFELPSRTTRMFESDALLDGFYDVGYAYRFGPPGHDVTIATLRTRDGEVLADAFDFPLRAEPRRGSGAGITATARRSGHAWRVSLESERFLFAAHVDGADDDYFHLPPRRLKTLTVHGAQPAVVDALNLAEPVPIVVSE
ncbi:MAG: hypothetical protein JWO97_3453 [Acidobacteria bacterium]|nr:hypothetical protein [Acidobacteriota bacterium]